MTTVIIRCFQYPRRAAANREAAASWMPTCAGHDDRQTRTFISRLRFAHNDGDIRSRSRGAFASEWCDQFRPLPKQGRREGRVPTGTRGPRAERMHGAGTTGTAGTTRPSLRDGLHAYSVLSPVSGLLATVVVGIITRQLGASIGAPGPHSFTSARRRSSARR